MTLEKIVLDSRYLFETLSFIKNYSSENLFLAAGAVAQTVWNHIYGNDPEHGIEDIDLIYFNNKNNNLYHEEEISSDIRKNLRHITINFDIKNQARVHLWYKEKFGYEIDPITSIEDAIERFPTTATTIGIKYSNTGFYSYEPFGLKDLFSGIIRPNKRQITETIYYSKVNKWLKKWPKLKVVEW